MIRELIIKHLGINNVEMQKKALISLNLRFLNYGSKIINK